MIRSLLGLALAALLLLPALPAVAREADPTTAAPGPPTGFGLRLRTGVTYQFSSSIDDGGRFDATRAIGELGARYAFSEGTSVGVSLGYAFDDYGFSSGARLDGIRPWDKVQTLRASLPLFWQPSPNWQLLAIPNLRAAAESPSDWNDGLQGGAIVGFSYRFSDTLLLGPGIGYVSQLEDDGDVFPILVVDWKVTERLRLETGRGLGATRGPGILASYEVTDDWQAALGFRRDKERFRLRDVGGSKGGVGEDRSWPVFAGLTWGQPWAQVSLLAGVELGGELRIEDSRGNRIARSDYDPAPFIGLTAEARF
jgi:hypothetical protein